MAYLLKTSNACRGEGGMLHLGVADCVGQYPVVRTLTVRSTPPSDTWSHKRHKKHNQLSIQTDVITPCTLMTFIGAIRGLETDTTDRT